LRFNEPSRRVWAWGFEQERMRVDRQESFPSSVEQFDEGCQRGMFQDVAKVADVAELLVESHRVSECRLEVTLTSNALLVTQLTCSSACAGSVRATARFYAAAGSGVGTCLA
jgi:hypothetical protein